jgi:transposase-like protein
VAGQTRYSDEFRLSAVRQALTTDAPTSHIAKSLGLHPDTLRRWIRQHSATRPDSPPAMAVRLQEPTPSARAVSLPGTSAAESDENAGARWHPDEVFPALSRITLTHRIVLIVLAWSLAVLASMRLTPSDDVRAVALVLHVLALVVAFGAVVVVDWHGLLWMAGRRGLRESTRVAASASPLIWGGVAGLLCSGVLLNPDPSRPLTWVKLALVLVLAVNGAGLSRLRRSTAHLGAAASLAQLPRRLRHTMAATMLFSQTSWWGVIVIGFVTSAQRA